MHELIEIPMSELTDTELDAVGGGLFNLANLVQANTAVNVGVALGGRASGWRDERQPDFCDKTCLRRHPSHPRGALGGWPSDH